jgi:hypothetical protein
MIFRQPPIAAPLFSGLSIESVTFDIDISAPEMAELGTQLPCRQFERF